MLFLSCNKDKNNFTTIYNLPQTPFNYSNVIFPKTFTAQVFELDNTPENNKITDAGATLGRVLFYDKNLSFNKTISCASCHIQKLSFANSKEKSDGFNGEKTRRNSMHLINTRFYQPDKYFWDHREKSLEQQVLKPFQDQVEMGMTLDLLVERVSADYYKPLFKEAFGDKEVTNKKIARALAQFIRSIYSFNSKYDKGLEVTQNLFEDFPNYTEQENLGKKIFNGQLTPGANATCAFCHMNNNLSVYTKPDPTFNQVIFSGTRTDNLGLDENPKDLNVDNGLGEITKIEADNGEFKAPTLRNVAITAPYMHDGRFKTLEEVVEHYSTGVKNHPRLSDHLINGDETPRHLNLSEEEKAALVAFLKTLTDEVVINEIKYSDPFVN